MLASEIFLSRSLVQLLEEKHRAGDGSWGWLRFSSYLWSEFLVLLNSTAPLCFAFHVNHLFSALGHPIKHHPNFFPRVLWFKAWEEASASWRFEAMEGMTSPSANSLLLFSYLVVSNSLQAHGQQRARFPHPSPSPRVCLNLCPLSQGCHPTIFSSVTPFSCPQSFQASGSFTMCRLFASGGQSTGASESTFGQCS